MPYIGFVSWTMAASGALGVSAMTENDRGMCDSLSPNTVSSFTHVLE